MYYYSRFLWTCIYFALAVCGQRDLFNKKCKRTCNTEYGTLDCWKTTTDGFTYGLSTAMIDYCQVILQLRQMTDDKSSWYNISRDILTKQIDAYTLDKKARQLSKTDTEQVAQTLLDQCFYASSSISSSQPSCPSCSTEEVKSIKQWRLLSFVPAFTCLLFIFVIILLYSLQISHTRRSYESIG